MDIVSIGHLITPPSPHQGIYFDGSSFYLATYSSEGSDGYLDEVLGLSKHERPVLELVVAQLVALIR